MDIKAIAHELTTIARELKVGWEEDPDVAYETWRDEHGEIEAEREAERKWEDDQRKKLDKAENVEGRLIKTIAKALKRVGMDSKEYKADNLSIEFETDRRWLIDDALDAAGFRQEGSGGYSGTQKYKKGDDVVEVQWGYYHRHSDVQEGYIWTEKGRKIFNWQQSW